MKLFSRILVVGVSLLFPHFVSADPEAMFWLTKGNQSVLFQKQKNLLFGNTANQYSNIEIDTTQTFQTIDGFGFTLTEASAYMIMSMNMNTQKQVMSELFGNDPNSIGISFIRISIGASDLSTSVYSYDDIKPDETDAPLDNFNLGVDRKVMVPMLQSIIKLNPKIKILATPWSAPAWMKDNHSPIGGTLVSKYYAAYANYLVKYLQEMKALGIPIDLLSIQHDPLSGTNNPSMLLPADKELTFLKSYLGPAIKKFGLNTKVIIYDQNCDNTDYATSILKDQVAGNYIAGTGFHLYAGDIKALTTVHEAAPDKGVYFTEQSTLSTAEFANDLKWHFKNVLIGATRNWSKCVLEWNLAADVNNGPHTAGGCNNCKGALTINGSSVKRNVSYYIIAHAAKAVTAGSTRIASTIVGDLQNVAFVRPDGKKVLIVENDGTTTQSFNIKCGSKWCTASLDAGSVGTYVW